MKTLRNQKTSQKRISFFRRPACLGFLLTVLIGSPLLGQPSASPANIPGLELRWSDHYDLLEAKLPVGGRQELWKEIDSIFGEIGIPLEWDHSPGSDRHPTGALAVQIILVPKSGKGWGLPSKAMGVVMGRQTRARNLYVFFPAFLAALGEKECPGKFLHNPREARIFVRALARVIAHEVVHAVDPSIPHRRNSGILSANLSKKMLRQENLSFASDTTKRLLASMTPPQNETENATVVAASSNPD